MSLLDDASRWRDALAEACASAVQSAHPPPRREPVHTLYWGAHRFESGTLEAIARDARASMEQYAPDTASMSRAFGTSMEHAEEIHAAVTRKLEDEPLEDLRLDFEDGYGRRPDDEETAAATATAAVLADAIARGTAPRRAGIRIKSLTPELLERSVTTLERFVTTLADKTGGAIGDFVVTLPKVTVPEQLQAINDLLFRLEQRVSLPEETIGLEFMVEVPGAVFDPAGDLVFPALLAASGPRLIGVHLGVYDYTAAHGIAAMHQGMDHPACHFVRGLMALAFGGRGIVVSAGSNNVLPVGPQSVVEAAWKRSHDQIRDAMRRGFYHGWDLHPAQLPARFAAVFGYYLEGADSVAERMRQVLAAGSAATDDAAVLDDVATGQALFELYRRGHDCGALDDARLSNAGLAGDDLRHDTFAEVVANRRGAGVSS